jgi:hypothetical protein
MKLDLLDLCFQYGDFLSGFCEGCGAYFMEDDTGCGYCPANDDPSDRGCWKHSDFLDIKRVLGGAGDEVNDIIAASCGERDVAV